MHLNKEQKTNMPDNNSALSQSNHPKRLRNMCYCVPVDANGDKPKREMVSIIEDNTKPRNMYSTEMVRVVTNPINRRSDLFAINEPNCGLSQNTKNEMITMYSDEESCFVYIGGIMYFNGVIPIVNCKITILETVYSNDEVYYRCTVEIKGDCITKDVTTSNFSNGRWLFSIPGVCTVGERVIANRYLLQYLDDLVYHLDPSKRVVIYEKSGWYKINGKYVYLTPIGPVDNSYLKSYAKHGQSFSKVVPNHNAFAEYVDMVNITKSSIGAILVLYTAMSLLNSLYREAGFSPKFVLFLNGYRGSYKTSLATAMTTIPFCDRPQYTLKGTKAGLESSFKNYRDMVAVFDDLAPVPLKSELAHMLANLEVLIRAFGDASGHKRATVEYEAEGGAIITGEFMTGCDSTLARCLFLDLDKNDVNLDLLSKLQKGKHVVEEFALSFISNVSYLINQCGEDIIGYISKRGDELRREYCNCYANQRYAEYLSQLQVCADILLQVAQQFNLIPSYQIPELAQRFSSAIRDIIDKNNKRLIRQSPLAVLCTAIHLNIVDEEYPVLKLGSLITNADATILYDDDYFYMTQRLCCSIVNNHIHNNSISIADFTVTSVADTLKLNNIISTFMEGKVLRKAIKLPKYGNKRFMKINKSELKKHVKL